MFWDSPEKRLAKAKQRGDIAWCEEVCRIADKADALMSRGKADKATQLYRVIAELDIDDKLIAEVVNHSRTVLEQQDRATPPTIAAEYQHYLDSLPPHDRHVMLARQFMRQLSGAAPKDDRPALIAQVIEHFEAAAKIKPLGKKD